MGMSTQFLKVTLSKEGLPEFITSAEGIEIHTILTEEDFLFELNQKQWLMNEKVLEPYLKKHAGKNRERWAKEAVQELKSLNPDDLPLLLRRIANIPIYDGDENWKEAFSFLFLKYTIQEITARDLRPFFFERSRQLRDVIKNNVNWFDWFVEWVSWLEEKPKDTVPGRDVEYGLNLILTSLTDGFPVEVEGKDEIIKDCKKIITEFKGREVIPKKDLEPHLNNLKKYIPRGGVKGGTGIPSLYSIATGFFKKLFGDDIAEESIKRWWSREKGKSKDKYQQEIKEESGKIIIYRFPRVEEKKLSKEKVGDRPKDIERFEVEKEREEQEDIEISSLISELEKRLQEMTSAEEKRLQEMLDRLQKENRITKDQRNYITQRYYPKEQLIISEALIKDGRKFIYYDFETFESVCNHYIKGEY